MFGALTYQVLTGHLDLGGACTLRRMEIHQRIGVVGQGRTQSRDIKLGGNYGSFPGREISHDKVGTMKLEDPISFDPGRKRRFITAGRKTS